MIRWNKRRAKRIFAFVAAALVLNVIFPAHTNIASAQAAPEQQIVPAIAAELTAAPAPAMTPAEPEAKPLMTPIALPVPKDAPAKKHMTVQASAYSSTVDQCDADPFTTASGQKVRDGIIAVNGLPFGTRVRIPSHFGNKVFVVQDRMNARWGNSRIDIWMPTRNAAIQWGVRTVQIEIL